MSEPTGRIISRVSVERPLWRALAAFRIFALAYAVARFAYVHHQYRDPVLAWTYLGALAAWTFATFRQVGSARRCTPLFLAADLAMSLTGVLLTMAADSPAAVDSGANTLPGIWTAGSVLAFAIKGGWRWAAPASAVIGLSNIVERGRVSQGNAHSIVLLFLVTTGIGYVVEVARGSERVLTRALQIEAATRERERLAREVHDSVLQVLAMVQRRGGELGGEAAELGRLAGGQEAALRALMLGGTPPAPRPPAAAGAAGGADGTDLAGADFAGVGLADTDLAGAGVRPAAGSAAPADLGALLAGYASARVTVAAPAGPVPLSGHAAAEVIAAVGAALDNVARHAGPGARAWILLEDEGDAVLVSVRDDGAGMTEERLAAAEREGRLGVAQSIRGRLADLGGSARFTHLPGQGVEIELRVPRVTDHARGDGRRKGSTA